MHFIKKIVIKEKNSKKIKDQGGTQSYDNYHFVFNSNSSKKEILRLNNPQNNNKLFYGYLGIKNNWYC